jgi:hypothetical protein
MWLASPRWDWKLIGEMHEHRATAGMTPHDAKLPGSSQKECWQPALMQTDQGQHLSPARANSIMRWLAMIAG